MAQTATWLYPTPQGLYCAAGDFHIDPPQPVARAIITHGHSDHARAGHAAVLATRETLAIMRARLGEGFAGATQPLAYGEPLDIGGVDLRLAPAGHVLGSAQVVMRHAGRTIVVSGDYKRTPDPTCPPFEPQRCDVFVTEATFGLPVFRHEPPEAEIARLLVSMRQRPGRSHLIGVYGLGKCQRLLRLIRLAGYDAPIHLHGALQSVTRLYEALGHDFGELRWTGDAAPAGLDGALVLCPPSALADRWSRRFDEPVRALASGWMRVRARARQRGADLPLVISDHADWPELLQTIVETGAEEIWVTHGREDALVHQLALMGRKGRALSLVGFEDRRIEMRAFAELLDSLAFASRRTDKLALLEAYLRDTPDPDRGWALAALTDGLPLRLPLRRVLGELMADRVDPVLYQLSRDYVGDTAETVALLWPDAPSGEGAGPLGDVVDRITGAPRGGLGPILAELLDRMTSRERWALLKLLGGAPRVGVSARLAKIALAQATGADVSDIEEIWHGLAPPYRELFDWLGGHGPRPEVAGKALFRPMMLAVPLAEDEVASLPASEFAAEWKWDGIRIQIVGGSGPARIFSRTGDEVSTAFPEIVTAFTGQPATLDGELLVAHGGVVAPFADLQQRLNRKAVAPALVRRYPAFVRLYDVLMLADEDLRTLPFVERRARLETWHRAARPPLSDLSEMLSFADLEELKALREGARASGIEGLMLKRKASPYLAGRPKGHWYKWKRDALTLDCVLMYAQRSSGKRSSFYSDYTFGVWRQTPDGARELVPIGKAYSGFTDEELRALDRFIRLNTIESFGPVRALKPLLVLEVAFDALQASKRHKSGLAMRFPRIHRIRWDKPAEEADTIEAAHLLL